MTRGKRTALATGALVAMLAAGLLGSAAAGAATPTPDDVVAAFTDEAFPLIQSEIQNATAFGAIHQINVWSDALLHGRVSDAPVVTLDEWIAPIVDDSGTALGTYRVWRPSTGAPAVFAGYDSDAALGAALSDLAPSLDLVSEPATAAWYSFDGALIAPLNAQGRAQFADQTGIDVVATVLAERTAQNDSDERSVFLNGWLMGGFWVLVLAGVGVLAYVQARGRRD